MVDWQSLFEPTVPLLEGFARGTATYLALLVLMRLVGQRESGGLGITDVLLVVLVADAAGTGMTGDADSVVDGFVLAGTVIFWSIAIDAVTYRFPRLSALLKARPRPLIQKGRLNRRAMRREFMSEDEVVSQLRLHGIEDIGTVDRAYLEPNGMISVIRSDREENEPTDRPEAP
ncbi:DUF421 domain-containing protein [Blastococcus sp. TF02A-26]|uniref:DUF421 domain-containing protein n=1 Tax=Blastococcus sp. TF02A-26 TaxID=2250577 RepID=UPI000DEB1998|nr:YetF domain-containing protein [Blastococcus sp. TF02A-26]RBY79655.1 hypothetical protein DQ240_22515 [Blastococcus sp. TF02A-26]